VARAESPFLLLHELLDKAVDTDPDRIAVSTPRESWSYAHLDAAANAMAASLLELGVQRGDRVGILLPKHPEAIAAIYGTLKAGAAYVPLDLLAPLPYAASICSDCELGVLVTTGSRASGLLEILKGKRPRGVVLLEEAGGSGQDLPVPSITYSEAAAIPSSPAVRGKEGDLACLLYTSGSAGTPKGVMHTHAAIVAGSRWFCQTMGIGPDDRLYAHAPLHFMLSVYAVFPAAMKLATSVLSLIEQPMRGDMARLVPSGKITVWVSTPFPLQLLISSARSDSLASLRTIMAGGGSLLGSDVSTLRRLAPEARVWQGYGSTEAGTVCCNLVEDVPAADQRVPIGRPVQGVTVLLVREEGSSTPDADQGELFVRSPRLMQGYWADPDLTAQVLVAHPWDGETGGRFYRTGDIVRRREDGKLEYLKRTDSTVKSRGYRIDLAEVEAVLNVHPAARESVAVAVPHPEWEVAVNACVEVKEGSTATASELRGHVAARLPAYMVPQRIRIVSSLPRTSTGKVDRQLLASEFSKSL
jgi:amino acid adenylation domain-containing protein